MKHEQLWKNQAALLRRYSISSTTAAGSGHPTSCLSCADIAAVLFDKYFTYSLSNPFNVNNDRFILSKGHAAPLLYAIFAMAGAYPPSLLNSLRKIDSPLEGHPTPNFKYADAATGSLGQGLSIANGLALISKREKRKNTIFTLLGDGELAEGQVWEAAQFASYHKLNNLVAILDINRLGQSGKTMLGHRCKKYADRFSAFGFETILIDGHDYKSIDRALEKAVHNKGTKPIAIVAETLKGKGVSFVEDKEGWHGKAFNEAEMKKAFKELPVDESLDLHFKFKVPKEKTITNGQHYFNGIKKTFDPKKEYSLREVFGESLAILGKANVDMYALDGDVKNSTFTEDFYNAIPERFIECFIAEQNMVSVAVGLSRLGKIPFVATFGAFLSRAADQVRMARISDANINFIGTHTGVSIGEDGPSQMALEDIAIFGAFPQSIILQPADALSVTKLLPLMLQEKGIHYMRIFRPKAKPIYQDDEIFTIGGSKVLIQGEEDALTVAATGITVAEAMKAAEILKQEDIHITVIDCYSVKPIDKPALINCLQQCSSPVLITVEDHFMHGGLGDFAAIAVEGIAQNVIKMAVKNISHSGNKDQLLQRAGIDAAAIVTKVKELITVPV
ncbi:MAG: transketolase [Niastella sp.]|nr:transketolase [Niastella sp.]